MQTIPRRPQWQADSPQHPSGYSQYGSSQEAPSNSTRPLGSKKLDIEPSYIEPTYVAQRAMQDDDEQIGSEFPTQKTNWVLPAAIIITLVLVAVAFGYNFYYGNEAQPPATSSTAKAPRPSPTVSTVIESDGKEVEFFNGINVTIPAGWSIEEQEPGLLIISHNDTLTLARFSGISSKAGADGLNTELKKFLEEESKDFKDFKISPVKTQKSKYDGVTIVEGGITGIYEVGGEEVDMRMQAALSMSTKNGMQLYSTVQRSDTLENYAVEEYQEMLDSIWSASQQPGSGKKTLKLAKRIDFDLKPGWKTTDKKDGLLRITHEKTLSFGWFETDEIESGLNVLNGQLKQYMKDNSEELEDVKYGKVRSYDSKYRRLSIVEGTMSGTHTLPGGMKVKVTRQIFLSINTKTGLAIYSVIQTHNPDDYAIKEFAEMTDQVWRDQTK
ncbi:MAG: hypothetical protein CSA83_00345 [Actinomycetales bacterium]|nr:MAG: hypothetical protein CSA83_00345 [Actinomycetales bacterium]